MCLAHSPMQTTGLACAKELGLHSRSPMWMARIQLPAPSSATPQGMYEQEAATRSKDQESTQVV